MIKCFIYLVNVIFDVKYVFDDNVNSLLSGMFWCMLRVEFGVNVV